MKKSWIVAGLVIATVVAVGIFILTTKNAEKQTTAKQSEIISGTEIMTAGNGSSTEYTEKVITQGKVNPSVNFVPSSEAGGEKEWLAGYAEENLSAPVLALLGLDGKLHDYNSLLSAIAMLPKGNIAADDVAALRDMLTWPNDQFPEGMRPIEINAVKNDVLDRLLRQKELPEGIGLQLVEMASNLENDPALRDYCVQFMSTYYERAASELHLTTEPAKKFSKNLRPSALICGSYSFVHPEKIILSKIILLITHAPSAFFSPPAALENTEFTEKKFYKMI